MKTVDEIIEYIDEADEWTADKELGLICRMGGGRMIDGIFHANSNYKACDDKIRAAKRKLEKQDNETTWKEFQDEVSNMFA